MRLNWIYFDIINCPKYNLHQLTKREINIFLRSLWIIHRNISDFTFFSNTGWSMLPYTSNNWVSLSSKTWPHNKGSGWGVLQDDFSEAIWTVTFDETGFFIRLKFILCKTKHFIHKKLHLFLIDRWIEIYF